MSPLEWVACPYYEVVDGIIQGYGDIPNWRRYYPFDNLELPNALAKVDPTSTEQILEFVHRYGTLGGSPDDTGKHGESEAVTWIQKQITAVNILLKLVECSRNNDEETASVLIDRTNHTRVSSIPLYELIPRQPEVFDPGLISDTPLGWVRRVALLIINSNITGIYRQATIKEDGKIESAFYFSSMLDVIYWHILNAMEGGADIGRCEECGTPFIKTDGRQRFCPKQYGEKESRCGMVYHQRQRKIRLDKQKAGDKN